MGSQGSILGPYLCNAYLHQLDMYLQGVKAEWAKPDNQGNSRRKRNPEDNAQLKQKSIHNISSFQDKDESFKQMRFVRYADDCLIGVIGSKEDCIQLREKINHFLDNELQLALNMEKTSIIHATTESPFFLGHYIKITPEEKKATKRVQRNGSGLKMRIFTRPQLIAPIDKLLNKLITKGFAKRNNITKTIKGTCCGAYTTYDDKTLVMYLKGL